MTQYGSAMNTKLDYQKMTHKYAIENLKLIQDYQALKQALKLEQEENGKLKEEAQRLRRSLEENRQFPYLQCSSVSGAE